MPFYKIDNKLIEDRLAIYRSKTSSAYECYTAIHEASSFMAVETAKFLRYGNNDIQTLTSNTEMYTLDTNILLVPKVRSGLTMVHAFIDTLHTSQVGFVLLGRNNARATDIRYSTVPETNAQIIILDPLIGTGKTINFILNHLEIRGLINNKIIIASLMISESGIKKILDEYCNVSVLSCLVTEVFDSNVGAFPRTGDLGDRVYTL